MKTILVTGASGFIGRHLQRSLAARGDHVVAISRSGSAGAHAVDLADRAAVRTFAHSHGTFDATIHLAANIPQLAGTSASNDVAHANVTGLENLLDAWGARLGHLIYASTIDVYGNGGDSPYEETRSMTPATAYGESKAAGETRIRASALGSRATILRLSQAYGPGERPIKAIPRFVECIKNDRPLVLAGGGVDKRRYLAVADAVRAFERAVDSSTAGTFNIAGDEIVSIGDLVGLFERLLGRRLVVDAVAGSPSGDRYVSIEAARTMLGFTPAVSLEDGLRACLEDAGVPCVPPT